MDNWAPSIGLEVREVRLKMSDLLTAEEVFYSNSLQTVRPIFRLGKQNWIITAFATLYSSDIWKICHDDTKGCGGAYS